MTQDNNADSNHQVVVPSGQGVQAGDHNTQVNQFIKNYIDNRGIPSGSTVVSAHVEEFKRIIPQDGERPSEGGVITRVPRTDDEREQLLRVRPEGWEYLYLSGRLIYERNSIEAKYRDYEIGYAALTGEVVSKLDIFNYIGIAAKRVIQIITNLTRAMSASAQENAVGALGQAGNAEGIAHLASRWNEFYESLMDWVAQLRGAIVPSGSQNAVELLAKLAEASIRDYRKFVDDLVAYNDELPRLVAAGEDVHIKLTLKLTIPSEATRALSAELERLSMLYIEQ